MQAGKRIQNSMLAGIIAAGIGPLPSAANAAASNTGTPMTAGVIVDEMPVRERTSFVMGIVEAMAYARFVKDTKAKGEKDHVGMDCIYGWFHKNGVQRMSQIDAAFRKYKDHLPSIVMTAMIRKACGE